MDPFLFYLKMSRVGNYNTGKKFKTCFGKNTVYAEILQKKGNFITT